MELILSFSIKKDSYLVNTKRKLRKGQKLRKMSKKCWKKVNVGKKVNLEL